MSQDFVKFFGLALPFLPAFFPFLGADTRL